MPSNPTPGFFNLWSSMLPPLKAGQYRLDATLDLDGASPQPELPVEVGQTHITVDAPRFSLPAGQLLSTYPPANATGAFSERLPQVVLKRRTLPWERAPGVGADAALPWLALVVVAEGEGQLSPEVDVAQCVTAGVTLPGPADVAKGSYLEVTKSVVDKIFPTKEDLALLCHVRQVDLSDTELALGDDDGWLAVVLANRLPWPASADPTPTTPPEGGGAPVLAPVRYLACLVNLEGQLDVLPDAVDDHVSFFVPVDAIASFDRYADEFADPDTLAMAQRGFAGPMPKRRRGKATDALVRQPKAVSPAVRASGSLPATVARSTVSDTWAVHAATQQTTAGSDVDAGRAVRAVMAEPWLTPIIAIALDPTYRFPVLAHWQFTVNGDPSFEGLMESLDVAMLGSVSPPDPALPPAPRPDPETTDTGHVGLPHLTRRGDEATAWYRGPLVPRPTDRDESDTPDGPLPVAHASDQLRRVTPDGREDLSYASAFEIGRLLALAQPSVVAGLMGWRAEQFGAARAAALAAEAFAGTPVLSAAPTSADVHTIGREIGASLFACLDAAPAATVGPRRPLADPGAPIEGLGRSASALEKVAAAGLGLRLDDLTSRSAKLGAVDALASVAVPVVGLPAGPVLEGPSLAALRLAAEAVAGQLAGGAAGQVGRAGPADAVRPKRRGRSASTADPLDRLLEELDR